MFKKSGDEKYYKKYFQCKNDINLNHVNDKNDISVDMFSKILNLFFALNILEMVMII
jgi:hypothetical protein